MRRAKAAASAASSAIKSAGISAKARSMSTETAAATSDASVVMLKDGRKIGYRMYGDMQGHSILFCKSKSNKSKSKSIY